jgi:hypothetical protein
MAKQYRIRVRGKQREQIDADLMAQLVVMMGNELAERARKDAKNQSDNDDTSTAERGTAS